MAIQATTTGLFDPSYTSPLECTTTLPELRHTHDLIANTHLRGHSDAIHEPHGH